MPGVMLNENDNNAFKGACVILNDNGGVSEGMPVLC